MVYNNVKEKTMNRIKQPYIVNPITENPYEMFTIPSRKVLAKTSRAGKFEKVVSLSKRRHHKAKRISAKSFKRLLTKSSAKPKVAKRTHKVAKRGHKISRKKLQKSFGIYKDLLKVSKMRMTKKDRAYKKHYKLNPLLVVNPRRRKSMARRKSWKRRNPFISRVQIGQVSNLLIDGALIVGGIMAGKFLMDNISKVKFFQKPVMKVGGQIVLGSLVYLIGSKIKKIPLRYTNLLALGIIAPAISDAVGMFTKKGEVSPVSEIGYEDEVSAYVPDETSAYIPETSSGLGDGDYTA